jgi:hypothetical protein
MAQGLDLSTIFKAVSGTLSENKAELNKADEYNHNHGDNMVEIFDLIQKSVSQKQAFSPSTQLSYASKQLQAKATSGSAKAYAQNLALASKTLKGKQISTDTIGPLIQSLMGLGTTPKESSSSRTDMLGSLLGGLGDSQQTQSAQGSGDLLGSLLLGLSGSGQENSSGDLVGTLFSGLSGQESQNDNGLDMGDILKAGMAFYGAKQKGGSNLEAIMSALSSSSTLGQSTHRKKSGALVVDTIMNLFGSLKK